jgi:hypothetical protein
VGLVPSRLLSTSVQRLLVEQLELVGAFVVQSELEGSGAAASYMSDFGHTWLNNIALLATQSWGLCNCVRPCCLRH